MNVKCELCSDSGDKAEAFCQHCAMFICKDCIKQHKRLKILLTHEVASLEDLKQGRAKPIVVKKPPSETCPDHEESLKLFCFDCDSLICRHCIINEHRDHNFEFCNIAASETKENLLKKLEPLKNQQESLIVDYTELCVRYCTDNEVMSMHTKIRSRIEREIDECIKLVRNLDIVERRDIGVELRCIEVLQQHCQTQDNIVQQPIDSAKCTVTMEDFTKHEVSKT